MDYTANISAAPSTVNYTANIFTAKTTGFHCCTNPTAVTLQFYCIFYRQPTVNVFLQFLHSIFALFVCKKCSESAVGFVHSEKPVLPLQILAV